MRRVHVVVLCEGFEDWQFALRILVRLGWRHDQIAPNVSPSAKGSAYTYVLNNYAAEVRANRGGKKTRALLVLIDADTRHEGGREQELNKRLKDTDQKLRQARERIALWVPRRQLETWVYFLTHGQADEETNYKDEHLVKEHEYKPASELLARTLKARRALPAKAIPSLKRAVVEFERLRSSQRKDSKRLKRGR
jgi:hypothetical protein